MSDIDLVVNQTGFKNRDRIETEVVGDRSEIPAITLLLYLTDAPTIKGLTTRG